MFARITAKVVLATIAVAMAFFGIGLLVLALVSALAKALGPIGGYALSGAILLLPPLIWALSVHLSRPKKAPAQTGGSELTKVLLAAVAKETPWIAIIGAGLAGAANMFLNRNKAAK
jgi:hypothetical protein